MLRQKEVVVAAAGGEAPERVVQVGSRRWARAEEQRDKQLTSYGAGVARLPLRVQVLCILQTLRDTYLVATRVLFLPSLQMRRPFLEVLDQLLLSPQLKRPSDSSFSCLFVA